MTQYQSDKIKIISFLSIILVLYIHSSFHDYPHEIQGMLFNHYLQELYRNVWGSVQFLCSLLSRVICFFLV